MCNSQGLINTPLERGVRGPALEFNRFSGFRAAPGFQTMRETAEAVQVSTARSDTPLKRGVNENLTPIQRLRPGQTLVILLAVLFTLYPTAPCLAVLANAWHIPDNTS